MAPFKYLLFIVFVISALSPICAQTDPENDGEICGSTMQAHQNRMNEDPAYRKRVKDWRQQIAPLVKARKENKNPTCSSGPILVPIAVHFDAGIVPAAEEACVISIVQDQIYQLNIDILGLDQDARQLDNFASCYGADILGDACLIFCLATENHPSGYGLNNGDYAVTFGQLNFTVPSGSFTPVNADWSDYINVYVDNLSGGLLGISNGIPGDFNGGGVLVDNCVFGTGNINCTGVQTAGSGGCSFANFHEGEILTHELGHYFGLYHIWGDNPFCTGAQDQIADTPAMTSNYSNYTSCANHTSCSNLPTSCGSEDMYMNFMSYAGHTCMYMFTSDQSDVFNATAVTEGYTTTTDKCVGMVPIALFEPFGTEMLCVGDCIDYFDVSLFTPTSWAWTFTVTSGDIVLDISTSTAQNPTVCVTAGSTGVITTELIVTNSAGSGDREEDLTVSLTPQTTYYLDQDFDGYGNPNNTISSCTSAPPGYVLDNTDCDDTNEDVNPGIPETACDGIDNNCDGQIDENAPTYYADTDNDGYGDPNNSTTSCTQPAGFILDNTDCNDSNAAINPGATEICDMIDNNCNGLVDENGSNTYFADTDGDGFGDSNNSVTGCTVPAGYVTNDTDCDDSNAAINPGATEICDMIDNNCNMLVDENAPNTYYADTDGDGYGDSNNTTAACFVPTGYVTNNTDCNDSNAAINPGATEICDMIDNNCDGQIDETGFNTYYADTDGDGYGDSNSTMTGCTPPPGFVANNTDCNDSVAAINPGATEICDMIDNNCDGQVDENGPNIYYSDSDGDGYGNNNNTMTGCTAPPGFVTDNTDCNDSNAAINPGTTEICDDIIDNNCNGAIDEGCVVPDCDGPYLVINTITQNVYRAQINVTSDAIVNSSSAILYTAGTDIDLEPGFEVILGTNFEARIQPCTPVPPAGGGSNSFVNPIIELLYEVSKDLSANENISFVISNHTNKVNKAFEIAASAGTEELMDAVGTLPQGLYRIKITTSNQELTKEVLIIK